MKSIKFILLLIAVPVACFSQWQADLRLTNDAGISVTSLNSLRCVAASGNFVHAVWYDNRDGNQEIYYKRSTNGGLSWEADKRLTNDNAGSSYPSIAVSGSIVHVTWWDTRDVTGNVYYKRSTDMGTTWSADAKISNGPVSHYPSVTAQSQEIHIVYEDEPPGGNEEIFYLRSTDGGVTWLQAVRITNQPSFSYAPSVSVSGSYVHVSWFDSRDVFPEIYYKRSTDRGISWGADVRISSADFIDSQSPSIWAADTIVHLTWIDGKHGNVEIHYNRSVNNGTSWDTEFRLTFNDSLSYYPSVCGTGSAVNIVWEDRRDGNSELYAIRSTDGGEGWGPETRLTNNAFISRNPSITVSGSAVHVVWWDQRDGNSEIYYKKDPNGNPISVTNISNDVPGEFSLSQNYPNPFNPVTYIEFDVARLSNIILTVYNVNGMEVETLVDKEMNAGKYKAEWKASYFASGIYFYTLTAGQFKETKKMMLVK
jgi:hypothetical protein